MQLHNLSVMDFIRETGSSAPAPGGGSIAALSAASAAALIEMVANLTIGKEKYSAVQEEMIEVQTKVGALKEELVDYINKDSHAFNQIMAAYGLPKGTEEEKVHRSAKIQEATKEGARVPFEIGKLAASLMELAEIVIVKGNTNAITDGAIAVLNARVAVHSAFYNVKINLNSIKDEAFVQSMAEEVKFLENFVDTEEKRLLALVTL